MNSKKILSVSLAISLFSAFGLQAFAVSDLTFEERSKDIPVTINGHKLMTPFGEGQSTGSYPTLVDIDNDNDLDMFIGTGDATLQFYENQGTGNQANFVLVDDMYLGIDKSQYVLFPQFSDTDNDGDLDLYFGEWAETISYYKNRGDASNPDHVKAAGSETGIDVGNFAAPAFVDIDADGDQDLFVGNFEGRVFYYENTSLTNKNQFILTDNTYLDIDFNEVATPTFADIDDDGDFDLFVGSDNGKLAYYENTGSAQSPEFVERNLDFISVVEGYVYPTFGDIDGDGDLDLFIGNNLGNTYFFQNDGTKTNPNFFFVTNEYFHLDFGSESYIDFADLDDDADEDLFMVNSEGNFIYLENVGSSAQPLYELNTRNLIELNEYASSFSFGDLDGDEDIDIVIGYSNEEDEALGGHVDYLKNIGTVRSPKYLLQEGFFAGIDVGNHSTPELHDYDKDGDLDLFIGSDAGTVAYYKNTGTQTNPKFELEAEVFEDIDVDANAHIQFSDIDHDGDSDAILGNKYGKIIYYENVEGNVKKNFVRVGELIPDVGFNSSVTAYDMNFDNKMDLFITSQNGNIHHFVQTSKTLYPPEDITKLSVDVDNNDIMTISWNKSLNSEGDLKEYRLYQKTNNESFTGSKSMGKSTEIRIIDFNKDNRYGFKVTVVDEYGLESDGLAVEASFRANGDLVVQKISEVEEVSQPSNALTTYCASFSDVLKSSVSVNGCAAINFVKNAGIFTGNNDGTLTPQRAINRAEVTKVLVEAFDLNLANALGSEFDDVPKDEWYADYVVTAKANGIVEGYSDGTFKPAQTINKVELLKIVLETAEVDLTEVDLGSSLFADIEANEENEWFIEYTNYAHMHSLIEIENDMLNPSEPMTRMDVINMLYQLKLKGLAFN